MKNNIITRVLLFIPRKIFIAGRTQQEVLEVAAKLNSEGFLVTIDVLGEHSKNAKEVEDTVKEYEQLIGAIKNRDLKATISIKLTHLGLEFGHSYCFYITKNLVDYACQNNVGIEFDAEESKYNQETVRIFQEIFKNTAPTCQRRICLQANLKNSFQNLQILHNQGHPVRLVKGAYEETGDDAFQHRKVIEDHFVSLVDLVHILSAINRMSLRRIPQHAIATHDKNIISHASKLIEAYEFDKNFIEFQLLYGYLSLGRQLLRDGYPVRIYLPYGDDETALPYIWRRLKTPHSWRLFFDWLLGRFKTRF